MSKLMIVCAWCEKELGEKEGEGEEGITHGICEDCLLHHFPDVHEKMGKLGLLTSEASCGKNEKGEVMIDNTQQTKDYSKIRGMVKQGDYPGALGELRASSLSQSTKEHLQKALQSGDQYIIGRTFSELDMRIGQALCWDCWKET